MAASPRAKTALLAGAVGIVAGILYVGSRGADEHPAAGETPPAAAGAPDGAPAREPARARFLQRTLDFGAAPHGAVVRRTFYVHNFGGSPLVIESVRSSCACAVALP